MTDSSPRWIMKKKVLMANKYVLLNTGYEIKNGNLIKDVYSINIFIIPSALP
jgi:hypothetical protein